jgi:ferredoxin/coenzyme F420-reducing hydrogenase delta subunit
VIPWLPPGRRRTAAQVDLDNCNGCGRCVEDCPFSAVDLQPRTDGAAFSEEAIVSNNLCTGCGICVGACPTSTPFRRSGKLVPGIDLPDTGLHTLREQTLAATSPLSGIGRVMVYGCEHGPDLEKLRDADTAVLKLPCIAMLPPSFIDFLISRKHVDGVLLTGCAEGDCHYRLGQQWAGQRLAGERDPYLRARVPRERVDTFWAGLTSNRKLRDELKNFRARLSVLPAIERNKRQPVIKRVIEGEESHE